MMGVEDQFGLSGASWELIKTFELTAEHIAKRASWELIKTFKLTAEHIAKRTKALSEKKYK